MIVKIDTHLLNRKHMSITQRVISRGPVAHVVTLWGILIYMMGEGAFRRMPAGPGHTSGSWTTCHSVICGHSSQALPPAVALTEKAALVTAERAHGRAVVPSLVSRAPLLSALLPYCRFLLPE